MPDGQGVVHSIQSGHHVHASEWQTERFPVPSRSYAYVQPGNHAYYFRYREVPVETIDQ
jgi:hypothetical protein